MRLTTDLSQNNLINEATTTSPLSHVEKTRPMVGASATASVPSSGQTMNKLVPADQRLETLGKHFDEKTLKRMGVVECTTCANRTYQDESDDSGVSFQAPTKLSPNQAASAVRGHEQEHVVREQAKARQENKDVIHQSVQIHHAVCPECGTSYVSGGLTRTTTVTRPESDGYQAIPEEKTIGNLVDYSL